MIPQMSNPTLQGQNPMPQQQQSQPMPWQIRPQEPAYQDPRWSTVIQPARVEFPNMHQDTSVDKLAKQLSKMTAHIAEIKKRITEQSQKLLERPTYQRRQYNASTPATGANRTSLRCFRYGEEGHRSFECQSEIPRTM